MHIYKPSHVPVKLESEYCHSYKDSMVLCNILLVTNYFYNNASFHDRHESSLDVTWSISTYSTCCSAEACPLCILSEKLRNSWNGSLSFATYLCCGNELEKFVTNNLIGFPRTVDFLSIYPTDGRYERGTEPNMFVNGSRPVLVP